MSKQIIIERKEQSQTRNGDLMWKYLTTDGEVYTLFENTPMAVKGPFLNGRGAVLEIETEKKGEYENVTAAKFIRMQVMDFEKVSAGESKDLSVTLSYAVQLAANGVIQPEHILEWATRFYRHVTKLPPMPLIGDKSQNGGENGKV